MAIENQPTILLLTDDVAEESHTTHILSKYHFSNYLVKVSKAREASRYLNAFNSSTSGDSIDFPELIILCMSGESGGNRALAVESRQGVLLNVPLIVVAANKEEEDSIRSFKLSNTFCFSKPVGFFKLLEAMQKLGMFWIVLRPK